MKKYKVIKVCGNPHCCALYHNIPKDVTKCKNCDGKLIEINLKTYAKNWNAWHFQYDYETMDYFYLI